MDVNSSWLLSLPSLGGVGSWLQGFCFKFCEWRRVVQEEAWALSPVRSPGPTHFSQMPNEGAQLWERVSFHPEAATGVFRSRLSWVAEVREQNPNPHLSLNRLSIFSGSEAQGGVLEWVGKEGWPPTPAAPGLLQVQIHVAFLNVKAEAGISLGGWGQMSETTLLLPWFISLF